MSEVTPAELAEWLAESPEEARPDLEYTGRWFVNRNGRVEFHHALALWFTAATLWLWERGCWLQQETSCTWALCSLDGNIESVGEYPSPYHALAAAVREVRAEEGKHGQE